MVFVCYLIFKESYKIMAGSIFLFGLFLLAKVPTKATFMTSGIDISYNFRLFARKQTITYSDLKEISKVSGNYLEGTVLRIIYKNANKTSKVVFPYPSKDNESSLKDILLTRDLTIKNCC